MLDKVFPVKLSLPYILVITVTNALISFGVWWSAMSFVWLMVNPDGSVRDRGNWVGFILCGVVVSAGWLACSIAKAKDASRSDKVFYIVTYALIFPFVYGIVSFVALLLLIIPHLQ